MGRRWPVILLPGSVMPAGSAYDALIAELGSDADAHPKELEVYAGDAPPPGYTMAVEIAGIDRVAAEAGFERFHLVGYSGGGAASLAYTVAHPERLLSLALMEPAFAGWQEMTPQERATFERHRPLLDLDGEEQMRRFRAIALGPGAELPAPPGPPPPWMAKRPAGVRAFITTFMSSDLDLDALRSFDRPVLYTLGGKSNPDYWARMAERLSHVFPDFTLEVYPDRHHFDPPHRIEPARVAASLRALWSRADPRSA